ncbi:uncharacterized protein [Euphorbia lathyris]|uniref:uncharacterized protein isoform X1 n=1 Tax=Euphorbia lathyris TaxID=212925 RepID=UPI0033137DE3
MLHAGKVVDEEKVNGDEDNDVVEADVAPDESESPDLDDFPEADFAFLAQVSFEDLDLDSDERLLEDDSPPLKRQRMDKSPDIPADTVDLGDEGTQVEHDGVLSVAQVDCTSPSVGEILASAVVNIPQPPSSSDLAIIDHVGELPSENDTPIISRSEVNETNFQL